ncbi:MAG: hypothetical protein AAFS10_00510 [Myxococcota bacterium]
MSRLLAAVQTDILLQHRNQLYPISIVVSAIAAGALAWLSPADFFGATAAMTLLLFAGGSTLLYVVAMILLEKDAGTLNAICVSPLRPWEYLLAKTLTLTGLATLEGSLIVGGALLFLSLNHTVTPPNIALLLPGMVALGSMHVLAGIVLVVRYQQITEALIPMGLLGACMQLPALYMIGALDQPSLLLIPTAAPTLLLRGAFIPLAPWEWLYAIVVTLLTLLILGLWAQRAFLHHIVQRAG